MSDSTPILSELLLICACAPTGTSAVPSASAAASVNVWMNFISRTPPPKTFLNTKILVQLVHVRIELRVRDHVDDLAVLHHIMAVGDSRGKAEILLDQQDGEAFRLQAADGVPDLLDDHGGEAFGRLIQQEE